MIILNLKYLRKFNNRRAMSHYIETVKYVNEMGPLEIVIITRINDGAAAYNVYIQGC